MNQARPARLVAACIALFSMLFMQLALAAYACPNLSPQQPPAMLDGAGQPMADCEEADPESPALCHADTYRVTPSLEKPDMPAVLPFVAAGFALSLLWPEGQAAIPQPPPVFLHASGSSPPLAIRHCRFRL